MSQKAQPENARERLTRAKRVVVKIGSALISESPAGRPAAIADDIASLRKKGIEIVLVSSGAIALGMRLLKLDTRPTDMPTLQACAAVGQNELMRNWGHAFSTHNIAVGQVLITHDDIAARQRFLSARHALRAMLDFGVVPIINENDTVAVEEIKFGDNDPLAALICNLVSADALLIMTNVDGLHDGAPDKGGKRIPIVYDIDSEAAPLAIDAIKSTVGSGGMGSKVGAAKAAARHGVTTAVIPGMRAQVLSQVLAGEDIGTLFLPSDKRMKSRKHWLGYGPRPVGQITVDAGAYDALVNQGKSLLPAGVVQVTGMFERGDIVSLVTTTGTEFGRGLSGYSAKELEQLKGRRTTDIEPTLGYKYLDEVVHRDDLVLL
jgi:glutamate 5-kinase